MKTTMQAVRIHKYGTPEELRLEQAPKPEAAKGEVAVRVHACGVNPIDWKVRSGLFRGRVEYRLPLILGWDLSGVVETVGPEVRDWRPGDEVIARPDTSRDGCYAEYVTVADAELARKPAGQDHNHAGAIPLAGLTAYQCVEATELDPGQRVLVQGGAGGVGGYAIQLARLRCLRVLATAGPSNLSYLSALGAEEAIDYHAQRFEEVVHDVDAVIDLIGGDTQQRSWQVIKRGGIMVSTVGIANPAEGEARGVRSVAVWAQSNRAQLERLGEMADSGQLKVPVETVLPLADAQRAHELLETGHIRGKIVLQVV